MRYDIRPLPPTLPEALVAKAARAETATIGHRRQLGFVHRAVRQIMPGRVAGTAVTLALPGQDSTLLHHIIQFLRSGDVLVIDRLGDDKHACLGGGVAVAIKASGCTGVVLDGPATDRDEILAEGLPLWCRGFSSITTRLLDVGGAFNVDVVCGGAVVHPGDVVVADASGVLVMPRKEAEEDIDWALSKQGAEPGLHDAVRGGDKIGALSGASAMVEKHIE